MGILHVLHEGPLPSGPLQPPREGLLGQEAPEQLELRVHVRQARLKLDAVQALNAVLQGGGQGAENLPVLLPLGRVQGPFVRLAAGGLQALQTRPAGTQGFDRPQHVVPTDLPVLGEDRPLREAWRVFGGDMRAVLLPQRQKRPDLFLAVGRDEWHLQVLRLNQSQSLSDARQELLLVVGIGPPQSDVLVAPRSPDPAPSVGAPKHTAPLRERGGLCNFSLHQHCAAFHERRLEGLEVELALQEPTEHPLRLLRPGDSWESPQAGRLPELLPFGQVRLPQHLIARPQVVLSEQSRVQRRSSRLAGAGLSPLLSRQLRLKLSQHVVSVPEDVEVLGHRSRVHEGGSLPLLLLLLLLFLLLRQGLPIFVELLALLVAHNEVGHFVLLRLLRARALLVAGGAPGARSPCARRL